MRTAFRWLNRFMLGMWRIGWGPMVNAWPSVIGRIMVITHTGRRTGRKHQTPVNYALMGEHVYCMAGFGTVSDWYRNLLAEPRVEVWLPDGEWEGVARELPIDGPNLQLARAVMIASGFAAPLFGGIRPRRASDERLARAVAGWPLIEIRRTRPIAPR